MKELCPDCGMVLFERGPDSPAVRRCEPCWWAHQDAEFTAGRPVAANARTARRFAA